MKILSLLFGLALVTSAVTASAHAHLQKSSPADNSVITTSPSVLVLNFSEAARLTALSIQKGSESQQKLKLLPATAAQQISVPLPQLTPGTYSALHRLQTDEIFHFYLGDPVRMLQLLPDGQGRTIVLGPDVSRGQQPQVLVPRGVWQGSVLEPGGAYALLGCTVAPGFDYEDYESGRRDELLAAYPQFADLIRRLSHA